MKPHPTKYVRIILPDAVKLRMTRKGMKTTFVYEETFRSRRLVEATHTILVNITKALMPWCKVTMSKDGKTIRLGGTCDYHTFAGFVTGEFIMWTPMADMKLRDMLLAPVVRAGGG